MPVLDTTNTLTGKTIVVGGGTGDVGVGIVAALTVAGAHVIVPARSAAKADALRDSLAHADRLTTLDGFPVEEDGVAALRAKLTDLGPIEGAVASLGSWFSFGPLIDTTADQVQTAFDGLLKSHILFARAVVPAIKPGGTYITVNGAASEGPVPNSSSVSIMTHGLNMVTETLRAEASQIHVHTLMLRSIIATRARSKHNPVWVTAREVGEAAVPLFTPAGQQSAGPTLNLNPKR